MRRFVPVLAVALLLVAASACSKTNAGSTGRTTPLAQVKPVAAGKQLSVTATTTQIADFASNVGGDKVSVFTLVAAGKDPHDFEPTPGDVTRLNGSDLIFKNGAGLESNFRKQLDSVPGAAPIIDTSTGVTLRTLNGGTDPHIWHDPLNAKIMVNNIRDALIKRDPVNASTYQANALAYTQQLDQLDADIRAQIDGVPQAKRKLVTNHDAFGYFTDRYGINFVGSIIPSLDTSSEPNAKDTENLIKKIKAQHVCAIFTETTVNPKLEQQIAAEAGVKVYSNLYGDTLGPPDSDGGTYLKMERSNTKNMVAGMSLSC